MHNHTRFISSSIIDILENVVSANAGIGDGIETYPLYDYVMQSIFLKMTGFQEQKLKCICWELATNDYEYRYKRYTQKPLGECSTYDEKKTVYKDLIEQIKKRNALYTTEDHINSSEILAETRETISILFSNSNLGTWAQSSFLEFMRDTNSIKATHFATENNLFENVLQNKYSMLYVHRNRCAHNTLSYQQNLPTLTTLLDENYQYDNYFMRFALLIILDKIFQKLYGKYLEVLEL